MRTKKDENLYSQRFGIKLKLLRTQRGLSRKALTEKAVLSKSFVAKIEDGVIMTPSDETKEKIYKALELSEKEIEFMEDNAELYFFKDGENQKLEVSVPVKMNRGGTLSRKILDEYLDGISDENLYILRYCAEAIYNYENPEKIKEDLADYYKSIGEYDSNWRREKLFKKSKQMNEEYDSSLQNYIQSKVNVGDLKLTVKEVMENVKPKMKEAATVKKLSKLCEEGVLVKTSEGKKNIYLIKKQ